jgi:hypothetical protein
MHELGYVQCAAQGMRACKLPRHEMPDPKKETATIKIADDDSAAAVIRNQWHTQDIRQDNQYTDALSLANRPTKTESLTKSIKAISGSSRFHVYSDPSKLRVKLASEIRAINAFNGFLLGVHDKIEKFPRHSRFGLEQVLDVEEYKLKLYEALELYQFTLIRIRAEALKALRCQGNLGPQRVLHLLKDSISKQNTARQAKEQQADVVLEQNE